MAQAGAPHLLLALFLLGPSRRMVQGGECLLIVYHGSLFPGLHLVNLAYTPATHL